MALVEMLMPKMGESVMEGTILKWLKDIGDSIEQDESVLEVATDKVDTEVPAMHAGVLKEILAREGDVVQVGKPIAIISTGGDESAVPNGQASKAVAVEAVAAVEEVEPVHANGAYAESDRFYSPLVKSIAQRENISATELESIPGTGKDGRLTKTDLLNYVANRSTAKVEAPKAQPAVQQPKVQTQVQPVTPKSQPTSSPAVSVSGDVEIIEMDRMRKMIAERMVDSKRISPHVTSFVEADVTNVVRWRNKMKKAFQDKGYGNLTFTPIFIEAVAKALQDFPMINISVDGDKIIRKKNINIGMATALPTGNLIVPVIHNADQLNLAGITMRVNDLANRARENKLKPDELSGGTYTLSNVGSFGNVMGTPIIMQPQVAILAVGAIRKKPAVIETPEGDLIGIRHMMFLSHSYDHRVVDGALGGMFVRKVADYLENFDVERTA